MPLSERVTWLESDASTLKRLGHGTYWEMASHIVATGEFSPSDSNDEYGEREYHNKTEGVYLTDAFTAYAEHYAWPCNVFNNKCFYGIAFNVLVNPQYQIKARRGGSTTGGSERTIALRFRGHGT